jgi:hypothetical protein
LHTSGNIEYGFRRQIRHGRTPYVLQVSNEIIGGELDVSTCARGKRRPTGVVLYNLYGVPV